MRFGVGKGFSADGNLNFIKCEKTKVSQSVYVSFYFNLKF